MQAPDNCWLHHARFPSLPSLSCSVKETVMTACQSLASCGSVCPHLHPPVPDAEQTQTAAHPHANS